MGKWAKYGMKFFTLWTNLDTSSDFIFSNCYKVVS